MALGDSTTFDRFVSSSALMSMDDRGRFRVGVCADLAEMGVFATAELVSSFCSGLEEDVVCFTADDTDMAVEAVVEAVVVVTAVVVDILPMGVTGVFLKNAWSVAEGFTGVGAIAGLLDDCHVEDVYSHMRSA